MDESAVEDAYGYRGSAFTDVPLGVIPLQIALIVLAEGSVRKDSLPDLYAGRFGVLLGPKDKKWLERFAWSAAGRKFVEWQDETVLVPGAREPAIIDPPGNWTFNQLVGRAFEHYQQGKRDTQLFETMLREVFPAAARVPKLMTRVIGGAIRQAEDRSERPRLGD